MNRSAHEQAVKLSVQSSSAFGDMHLTNVCGECGRVQGDWTMDIDIHQRVVTSHTALGAYNSDAVVVAVGDVDRAVCGYLCAVRTVKSGLGGRAAVAVSA